MANRFAADLLLPADELEVQIGERSQKGKLEDLDLIDVARDFYVSREADHISLASGNAVPEVFRSGVPVYRRTSGSRPQIIVEIERSGGLPSPSHVISAIKSRSPQLDAPRAYEPATQSAFTSTREVWRPGSEG